MNRLLLFLGLLLSLQFEVSAQTCTPMSVPFLQNFNSGSLPSCWTSVNPGSTSTSANVKWKFTGTAGYGASGNGQASGSYAWVDASSPYDNIHTVELISPQINLTGLTIPYVEFRWYKHHGTSSTSTTPPSYDDNELKVEVNDGSGWVQIFSDDSNSTQWRTVGISLPATYANSTIQLKFTVDKDVSGNGYFYDDVLLDDVQVKEAPTCIVPSALTLGTVTSSDAAISWTAPASAPALGYDIYYNTTNTAPIATTTPSQNSPTTSATLSPLNSNTTYYVWVRSRCSATDQSDWVALPAFTTLCSFYTVPFLEAFNSGSLPGCWTNTNPASTSANAFWKFSGTPGYGANGNGQATGTYAWVDASSPWDNIHNVELTSPQINLTGLTVPYVKFRWYKNHSTSTTSTILPNYNNNELKVEVNDGTGWVQIFADDSNSTQWRTVGISLPATYVNSTIQLRFTVDKDVSANGYQYDDLLLDQVEVIEAPSCIAPSAMTVVTVTATSAEISWTAPSVVPGAGYDIYYSTTNTPPVAGTTPNQTVTTTTATLSPLASSTTYYVWVRSRCSSTEFSSWVSVPPITTLCAPFSVPFLENFNSGTLPLCWENQNPASSSTTALWRFTGAAGYGATGNGQASGSYAWVDASSPYDNLHNVELISPQINLTGLTVPYVKFRWYKNHSSSSTSTVLPNYNNNQMKVEVNDGSGWTQIWVDTTNSAKWRTVGIALPAAYVNATIQLKFTVDKDVAANGYFYDDLLLDDVQVLEAPTCFDPTPLAVTNITATSATLSWTPPTPAPANGFEYFISTTNTPPAPTAVGTPVAGTSVVAPLSPNTNYFWWVRSVCSASDKGLWIQGDDFMTTQIPATLPYYQGFGNGNDFGIINGTQTNKWYFGSAAGNPVNALYISNDNGVSNAYTINTTSVVHAFRDIAVPAGTTIGTLEFDWRAYGESSFDYIRVWLVPATFVPTAGTQINTSSGGVQVGQFNQQGATWQTYSNNNYNFSNYAGTTMRLVFEWRNDSSIGTQPPAAIDNIVIRVCSTETPVVTVDPTSITHNSATVTWPQDTGGADYLLRYRPVGSTTWLPTAGSIPIAAIAGTTQTYTFPQNLLPVTLYEVEIAAVCNSNTIGVYSHNEFTTLCDPTPPNITISNITTTSALITWSPLAASATYELRWREVGTTTWYPVTSTPQPPLNSFLLDNLQSYKTYEVQVRNQCIGSSTPNPWSSPVVFTTERECIIPPPGLTITQLNPTSAEVTWDPYSGAGATGTYLLQYRKVGIPSWTNVVVNTNTYTITGLLELTKYEMQVANICTSGNGTFTPLYYFTTPTVTYCPMSSGSAASEYISKVTVTPINVTPMENPSTGSTYTDYTGNPTTYITLVQGSQGNVVKVDKTSASGANTGVAVWIDFNRNGYFDVNEKVLSNGPNNASNASAAFTVPADAFVSLTDYKYVTMRVALQKDGVPVNCTSFDDGEVEDYLVRIVKQSVVNPLNQTDILIYPNPVSSVLYVKNISQKGKYKIYSQAGQLVASGVLLNNAINVSSLINGVYIIDIEDVQGNVQKKFIKE